MNELSIVIPCVSSARPMLSFLDEVAALMMSNPGDIDLIVVGNQSSGSLDEVSSFFQEKYPWLKYAILQHKGGARSYGALARFGLAYSGSHFAVLVSPFGDNDLRAIPAMLASMRKGAQVAQATRYPNRGSAGLTLRFRLYQAVYRAAIRLLLGFSISDSTYGFKMFDRIFIQSLGLNQNGYSICPEITLKTLLAGGKVEYISSEMKRPLSKSDFNLAREGIGYLWLLIRGCAHRAGVLWF